MIHLLEDYMDFTGSNEFPLQFCGTRWINSVLSGPKKKIPKCASFNELSEAIKDPLVIAKLHFFCKCSKITETLPYIISV